MLDAAPRSPWGPWMPPFRDCACCTVGSARSGRYLFAWNCSEAFCASASHLHFLGQGVAIFPRGSIGLIVSGQISESADSVVHRIVDGDRAELDVEVATQVNPISTLCKIAMHKHILSPLRLGVQTSSPSASFRSQG